MQCPSDIAFNTLRKVQVAQHERVVQFTSGTTRNSCATYQLHNRKQLCIVPEAQQETAVQRTRGTTRNNCALLQWHNTKQQYSLLAAEIRQRCIR